MSAATGLTNPGAEAIRQKGWLRAHKWLLLRRAAQVFFLAIFLTGPWAGLWLVEGTLSSSLTFEVLPLSDPYVLLQGLATGYLPHVTALLGGAIVLLAYALIGGRVYCSWVCPINPVTDGAHWLRERLGLRKGWQPSRHSRLWLLATTLAVSAVTGTIAWEVVNPITMLQRGLIFGLGFAWSVVIAVFLFDLFVSRRGWWRAPLPGRRLLRARGTQEPAAGQRQSPPKLRRLHGLLRRLSRAAGHHPRAQGRGQGPWASDPVSRLYQLRALHRCLFGQRLSLHPPFR